MVNIQVAKPIFVANTAMYVGVVDGSVILSNSNSVPLAISITIQVPIMLLNCSASAVNKGLPDAKNFFCCGLKTKM